MNWDVLKSKTLDALAWVSFILEKPAQLFAMAINYAPKTALVVAVLIAAKAYF